MNEQNRLNNQIEQPVNKQTLTDLLEAMEQLIEQKTSDGFIANEYSLLQELGEQEVIAKYRLVKYLLKRIQETGEVEALGRKEYLAFLPWKRTQTTIRLQELVREGLLLFEKRKYLLNTDNQFVKRVRGTIRYEFEEGDLEELIEEQRDERRVKLTGKTRINVEQPKKTITRTVRRSTKEEERRFVEGIHRSITEYSQSYSYEELVEAIALEIEQNILLTIGLVQRKQ